MDFIVLAVALALSLALCVAGARLVLELALLFLWRSVEPTIDPHQGGGAASVLTAQLSTASLD